MDNYTKQPESSQTSGRQIENGLFVENRRVPVVAFFGTKGGVGKTTIVDKFSKLVSRAPKGPNTLMVDFDIHHRGLTIIRTSDQFGTCHTIHEYMANDCLEFSGALDVTPPGSTNTGGREFIIPSSNLAAEKVFDSLTRLEPTILVKRLTELLNAAVKKHRIGIVIVDCGPVVDPLTASAAFMADMAFIIGQNEPITFQSLQNYAIRIRDFLPEFNAAKVRVVLNKVRGPIGQKAGIYAAIPFTMEVVDFSEGLTDIDEIRLIYLDYCVFGLVKSVLSARHEELVPGPEAIFTPDQRTTIDLIDSYRTSKWYSRLRWTRFLLYGSCASLLLALITSFLPDMLDLSSASISDWLNVRLPIIFLTLGVLAGGLGAMFYRRFRRANDIMRLKQRGGYEGLLELLTSRQGRQKFNQIRLMSQKTAQEK